MHLKPHAFGLAGAILTVILYVVESLSFKYSTQYVTKMWSMMSYRMDYSPVLGPGLDWKAFFVGLVGWVVMAYVGLYVFAWLYNRLSK